VLVIDYTDEAVVSDWPPLISSLLGMYSCCSHRQALIDKINVL